MNKKYDNYIVYGSCIAIIVFCFFMFGSVSADITYFNEFMDCDFGDYTSIDEWTNPSNLLLDDGNDAHCRLLTATDEQEVYGFGLRNYCYITDYNLNISYINVSIEGEGDRAICSLQLKISSDNGTSWSDLKDMTDFVDGVESVEYINLSVNGWNIPINYSNPAELGGSNWKIYIHCDQGIGLIDYVKICLGTNCSDDINPEGDYTTFASCRDDYDFKLVYDDSFYDNQSGLTSRSLNLSLDDVKTSVYNLADDDYISVVQRWDYENKTYVSSFPPPAPDEFWDYTFSSTSAFFIEVDKQYIENITSYRGGGLSGNNSYDNLNGYANYSKNIFGEDNVFNLSFDIDVSNDTVPIINIDNVTYEFSHIWFDDDFIKDNGYGDIQLSVDALVGFETATIDDVRNIDDWSDITVSEYKNYSDIGFGFYLNDSFDVYYQGSGDSSDFYSWDHNEVDNVTAPGGCSGVVWVNGSNINLTWNVSIDKSDDSNTTNFSIDEDNWLLLSGLSFDETQLSIFLTLTLFILFFEVGYKEKKRSGGLLMLFSGFILISFEYIATSYLNALYLLPLLTPIAIFIIILGVRKWLYPVENENTKSEGT